MKSLGKETTTKKQDSSEVPVKKVERGLIPFYGTNPPKKAHKEALKYLKKGGKLYLLHIVDNAPVKLMRSDTGQIGRRGKIIKTFEKTREQAQEEAAQKYVEDIKKEAVKKGVSVEDVYVRGDPAEEVLDAAKKYAIDVVFVEKLREQIPEIFFGTEINYLEKCAPCKVMAISK